VGTEKKWEHKTVNFFLMADESGKYVNFDFRQVRGFSNHDQQGSSETATRCARAPPQSFVV
jgi:hypothetical protein